MRIIADLVLTVANKHAAWMVFFVASLAACGESSPKDPDGEGVEDTDPPDVENLDCELLANAQWKEDPTVIRLDGNIVVTGPEDTSFPYAACSGAGWNCFTDYQDLNGAGSVSCWDGLPAADQPPDIIFTGSVENGYLGVKCEVVEDPEGQPFLFTSAQYAPNSNGDTNAGVLNVLQLDIAMNVPQETTQDVATTAFAIIEGIGQDAYFDLEYGPQPVIGGQSTELCFGNTNSDPSYGGLYCLASDAFWAIAPRSQLSVLDLFDFGAELYSHASIDEIATVQWYPAAAEPLSGGRRSIADPIAAVDGDPNSGIVHVIEGNGDKLLLISGSPGARIGSAVAEVPYGDITALISGSAHFDGALVARIIASDREEDLTVGTIFSPRFRQSVEAGEEGFTSSMWAHKMEAFEACGTWYVAVTAPNASKQLDSDELGALHIYRAADMLSAAEADPGTVETSPIPIVSVFGPEGANFGWNLVIDVDHEHPLNTRFLVGSSNTAAAHIFTFGSLRDQ